MTDGSEAAETPRPVNAILAAMLEGIAATIAAASAEIAALDHATVPAELPPDREPANVVMPPFPAGKAVHRRAGFKVPGGRIRNRSTFPQETFETVVAHVCTAMGGVAYKDVVGESRRNEVTDTRHYAMWILRRAYHLSQPLIGDFFGRDHSSVNSALKRIDRLADTDAAVRQWLEELMEAILHNVPPPPG